MKATIDIPEDVFSIMLDDRQSHTVVKKTGKRESERYWVCDVGRRGVAIGEKRHGRAKHADPVAAIEMAIADAGGATHD